MIGYQTLNFICLPSDLPLVVDSRGKITMAGQVQADSFRVSGQSPRVRVDKDSRQRFLLKGRIGYPVDPQLAPVKDQAFPDHSRLGGEGVDQEVIIRSAAKGREAQDC